MIWNRNSIAHSGLGPLVCLSMTLHVVLPVTGGSAVAGEILDRGASYETLEILQEIVINGRNDLSIPDRAKVHAVCMDAVKKRLAEAKPLVPKDEYEVLQNDRFAWCRNLRDRYLPTKFEHPFFFDELEYRLSIIRDSHIRLRERPDSPQMIKTATPPQMIKFGTLPTSCANALFITDDQDNRPLIIWKAGLGRVIDGWAFTAASIIPTDTESIKDGVATVVADMDAANIPKTAFSRIFIRQFMKAIFNLHIPMGVSKRSELTESLLESHLKHGMMLFVVAHEYSHLILGHLKKSTPRTSAMNVIGAISGGRASETSRERLRGSQVLNYNQKLELEADEAAFYLLVEALEDPRSKVSSPVVALWGPDIYFTFLTFATSARLSLEHGKRLYAGGSNTHPSPDFRRDRLRDIILSQGLKAQPLKFDFGSYVREILQTTWNALADSIFQDLQFRLRDELLFCPRLG